LTYTVLVHQTVLILSIQLFVRLFAAI